MFLIVEPPDALCVAHLTQTAHFSALRFAQQSGCGSRGLHHCTLRRADHDRLEPRVCCALDRVRRVTQERQSALAAAHAERELLERVFELSPSFLAVLRGPQHVFELTNPAYYQLVGHRELLGRPVREAIPEVEGQGFFELLDRVYATGEPFVGNELPIQLQTVPGGLLEGRYVTFVYQAMRGAGGEVTGILVTGVDVTALVRARQSVEQALVETRRLAAERDAERRQLLTTVLEQSPLGIAIAEAPSGRLLFSNQKFAETFDTQHLEGGEESSTQYLGYQLDGRPVAPHEWPVARAIAHGEIVENEILVVERTSGGRSEISFNAAPVRDADERITAGVVIVRDVTAERRMERQLRDTQRVQAVGTLAGGVAHEINNQMTAVLGFGAFVLRALGPVHPQAADMRLVLQAGQRAARISQQLLAFTRQQITQPQVLDLQEVVTELRPVLQHLLGSDKLLTITCATVGFKVSADPDQVQQVLINLVANARDATETGAEVRIAVEDVTVEAEIPAPLGEAVAAGRYVRLSVADPGSGMTAETLTRIFDPFFTTKAVGKGSGLGLPMVYGTMRHHDGYVVARSVPGVGTTMELYWPAGAVTGARTADGAPEDRDRSRAPGSGAVILVAEDDPLVRALVVRTLEEEGYWVVAAADGVEALEALERGPVRPEIVVTDVIMPRMNGGQMSDAVRARWPGVRVLFMSGHTGEGEVLERLVPAGAPFLQKPFTPAELVQAVGALRPRR